MNPKKLDYSIFDKFNFERKPVGVQYSLKKPQGIEPLDKSFALCELFKEAQTSRPFYAVEENIECGVQLLGMKEFPPIMHSGQLGPMYAMFRNPGANRRIYDYMPSLPMNSVKYVSFASFDQLTFDPDVLILTTSVSQAEIILQGQQFFQWEDVVEQGDDLPCLRLDIRSPLCYRRTQLHRKWPWLQHEGETGASRGSHDHYRPFRPYCRSYRESEGHGVVPRLV